MPTRQELIERKRMADEARRQLTSGQFSQPQQGYTTRQQQIDAYRQMHPAPPPSRFADIPTFKPQPVTTEPTQTAPSITPDFLRAKPAASPGSAQALQDFAASHPVVETRSKNEILGDKLKTIPVIGSAIRGLDWLSEKTKPAADVAQEFYTPGAGLSALGAAEKAGASLVGRALPKLESALFKASPEAAFSVTKAAPVITRAAVDAGIGAYTGAGQSLAAHPEQGLEGAAAGARSGAVMGGATGAAMPLLGKAARAVLDRFRKPPTVEPGPTHALPQGKTRGNVNGAQPPDVISPDYQFKLPYGDEYGIANRAAATEDLRTINQEIAHLNGRYEAAVNAEFKYLQDTAKQGVEQGQLHFDAATGDVVGRTGRQSKNEKWYRDFYAEHGRAPSKKEMLTLARQRVENGFQIDDAGNTAPGWLEQNDYHNTMQALTAVRDNLTKSLNQLESKHVITDAQIGGKELSFRRPQPGAPAPVETPQPKAVVVDEPPAPPKKESSEPKRANFETMAEAEGISPKLKKEIAKLDDSYAPITNKETVAEADASISKQGVTEAVAAFLSRESTEAVHIAEGYRLMQLLDARSQWEKAAAVAAKVAADLTKAGQQAQAGRIIKRLSPEGQMLAITRMAEKAGKTVSPEDTAAFSKAAKKYATGSNAAARTNAMQDVLDKLEAGHAPTEEDVKLLASTIKRARKFVPEEKPKASKPKPAASKRDKVLETMQAAEEEAWKRIKARRNIGFTPGKGNEVVDYAIIAANRVARGTIKASNHVEQIVELFGEKVRPIATKIYNRSLKYVARHPELKTVKKTVSTAEEVVKQWEKRTATSTADLEKVRELAKSLGKLEGKEGKEADVEMQQIMGKYEKMSVTDKVQALRFMAMLGNTSTQTLNATSNVAMATLKNFTDLYGSMLDAALSKALKRPRTVAAFGEDPFSFTVHLFKNMWEGAGANWKGINPAGLHSVSEIRGLAFKHKTNPLHWAERSLRAVAGGADYGVYKTQFDNEIRKQARLAAKMVPKLERAKFIRDFITNPPAQALEIADNIGKETTFQQKNSLGDAAANAVSGLGHMGGAGKVIEQGVRAVVPFIRTPLNILETGVNLTPGGLIRGSIELALAKTPAAQRKAVSQLSLGLTGTGLGAAGYYLHKIGIITGANDSGNAKLDEVRNEAGRGAYRFNQSAMLRYLGAVFGGEGVAAAKKASTYRKGDRTFNYNKLQPIAFPVALGAGIEEGGVKTGLKEGVGSLLNMSSLKSIQDVVNTGYSGSDGDRQLGVINRVVESYLKSFSPSLLAQEARRQDDTQRQTSFNKGTIKDVTDYYKSRTPQIGGLVPEGFTSKSLPEKVTPLGQTKKGISGAAGNYLNPYQSDVQQYSEAAALIADLIDKTGDDSIAPSAPAKKIKGVAIDPQRYAEYQRDIGEEITRKILDLNRDFEPAVQVKRIAKIMTDTKEKYAYELKREMGIR